MSAPDTDGVPVIDAFDAEPSEDGETLMIRATASDGSVLPFAIRVDDVKHFIALLLAWTGTIGAQGKTADSNDTIGDGIAPIPADSIAIGQPNGQEGYIGISVGRAELVFALPLASFGPLGRTLLMAGKPANATPA